MIDFIIIDGKEVPDEDVGRFSNVFEIKSEGTIEFSNYDLRSAGFSNKMITYPIVEIDNPEYNRLTPIGGEENIYMDDVNKMINNSPEDLSIGFCLFLKGYVVDDRERAFFFTRKNKIDIIEGEKYTSGVIFTEEDFGPCYISGHTHGCWLQYFKMEDFEDIRNDITKGASPLLSDIMEGTRQGVRDIGIPSSWDKKLIINDLVNGVLIKRKFFVATKLFINLYDENGGYAMYDINTGKKLNYRSIKTIPGNYTEVVNAPNGKKELISVQFSINEILDNYNRDYYINDTGTIKWDILGNVRN